MDHDIPNQGRTMLGSSRISKRRGAVGPAERQRAVRACAECRRLKEKCEDGMPCRRCRDLHRHCEYSSSSSSSATAAGAADAEGGRGGATASTEWVRTLYERARYMEALLRYHVPSLSLRTESLRRAAEGLPGPAPGREEQPPPQHPRPLAPVPPAAGAQRGAESEASPVAESPLDEVCTIDVMDDDVAHYSGELSHWNFSMRIKRNIDSLMATSQVPTLDRPERVPEFIRVAEPAPDAPIMAELLAALPPRPVADFLVHVFFTHAASFYFFLDRRWVAATLDVLYRDDKSAAATYDRGSSSSSSGKQIVPACAIVMVLAVGAQYAHLESPNQARRPSQGGQHGDGAAGEDRDHSWELEIPSAFYQQVARLLAEMIHSGSLISVQVCVLLGLYCLPVDASGLGYVYLNLALKLAIQNGMHRRPVAAVPDALKAETRCRLWWTVYCLERKIGLFHGRPPAIARADFDADLPSDRPEFAALSGSAHVAHLLDAIRLTGYAESFQHDLLLLRNCPRSEAARVIEHLKQTKADCARWWTSRRSAEAAATTTPTPAAAAVAETRVGLHARLERCLLDMFVGRPFLLTGREETWRGSGLGGGGEAPPWAPLVRDCIAAAHEAVDVCDALRTGPWGLARSAYAEYSACRASLLVLLACRVRPGRTTATRAHGATLQRGLAAIRAMAYAGDSARSEVRLIEALEAALRHIDACSPPDAAAPPALGGYEGFLSWCARRGGGGAAAPAGAPPHAYPPAVPTAAPASVAALVEPPGGGVPALVEDGDDDLFFGQAFPYPDQVSAFFNTSYGEESMPERALMDSLGLLSDESFHPVN